MDLDRNASAIVTDGDRSVGVDGDLHPGTISGQMFVDGVVENLEDAVVESSLIGITDVHAGALADRLESLQFVDLGGSVLFTSRGILLLGNVGVVEGDDRFGGWFFGHGRGSGRGLIAPGKGRFVVSRHYVAPKGWATLFWAFWGQKRRIWGVLANRATISG